MPLHSALAKLPARLLSWLRFLPRSWISVYILCVTGQPVTITFFKMAPYGIPIIKDMNEDIGTFVYDSSLEVHVYAMMYTTVKSANKHKIYGLLKIIIFTWKFILKQWMIPAID